MQNIPTQTKNYIGCLIANQPIAKLMDIFWIRLLQKSEKFSVLALLFLVVKTPQHCNNFVTWGQHKFFTNINFPTIETKKLSKSCKKNTLTYI